MKDLLTADDVLSDIEFELVQGAVSQDDLGQSIQVVRQYQNKVRGEVLQALRRAGGSRKVVTLLFQINEMLITLSQETAAAVQSLRVDLRKVARMSQVASPAATTASISATGEDVDASVETDVAALNRMAEDLDWQPPAEVVGAMRAKALLIEMELQPADIPIIGGLVQRLRIALHNLALFYVRRLARRQTEINQTYSDWILRLIPMCRYQQEQIDLLGARVASLEARLAELDEGISTSVAS